MTVDPLYIHQPTMPWVGDQITHSHEEVLYDHGEYAMFVLMWTPLDRAADRVGDCPKCVIAYGEIAKAYGQPAKEKCDGCFGTGFEGGYRAKIVRPSLWNDGTPDDDQTARGYVVRDTYLVETTNDFTMHKGDYVFRATGDRYQTEALNATNIQHGFGTPSRTNMRVAGALPQVRLENKTSVAYIIPPTEAELVTTLNQPVNFSTDLSVVEEVRGPLVLNAEH